ncbi:MAG: phage holin family protein [Bacteroidota bacterium]
MFEPILLDGLVVASTRSFLAQLLINALALLIASFFLDGVQVKGITSSLIVALVLAFLNATIGTYLTEITGFYKGILHFVVDAVVILIASAILSGFKVKGFIWAVLLAVALTILNAFLYRVIF